MTANQVGTLPIVRRLMQTHATPFVNPDGPEAAALITELVDALQAMHDAFPQGRSLEEVSALTDAEVMLAKVRS